MLKVKQFTVNHFMVNSFVLYDEATRECAIVDPGMTSAREFDALYAFIEKEQLHPCYVLLTHPHVDHLAGLKDVCMHFDLPVTLHSASELYMKFAPDYCDDMGFDIDSLADISRNYVKENDIIPVGDSKIEVRYVPGHAEGSLCYVADKMVLTGDALFRGSIGRTDLPGGDYDLLMEKIRSCLLTLPDDYEVLPGHGELSIIGIERRSNPFL